MTSLHAKLTKSISRYKEYNWYIKQTASSLFFNLIANNAKEKALLKHNISLNIYYVISVYFLFFDFLIALLST